MLEGCDKIVCEDVAGGDVHGVVVGGVVGRYGWFVLELALIRKFNLVCCSFGSFDTSLADVFKIFVSFSNELPTDADI